MNSKETLFYTQDDYKDVIKTLENLKPYIKCRFAIVGGIANRSLFPDWARKQKGNKFNDLDIVLIPQKKDVGENWIDSKIKDKFFIKHINKQYDGYYISLTDKETYVMVDIYTKPRNICTQRITLGGHKYYVLTSEEIYLANLRFIYETLVNDGVLYPKHLKFKKYLEARINLEKVKSMWNQESKIIRFVTPEYSFQTFDEYLKQIKQLQQDKKALIHNNLQKRGKKKYNKNCVKAFGISIENETNFYKAYTKRDKLN